MIKKHEHSNNKHHIISLSIDEELSKKIEQTRTQHRLQRSEFYRKAAIAYISELNEEQFTGQVQGVLTIVHQEKDDVITKLKHQFIGAVQTHLHTHLDKEHACLEVLILNGPATTVQQMLFMIRKAKGILSVKLALV